MTASRIRLAFLTLAIWFGAANPGMAQFGSQRGGAPGDFDFYVLALSWSPGWCAIEGDRKGSDQCRAGNHQGFVLHGLWPQYTQGFPSNCASAERAPSRIALDEARDLYPDEGLARYEWRKHGTCSGLDPRGYFLAAARAKAKVALPEIFRGPQADRELTPIDIERAFSSANPGLRSEMIAVACNRGLLQEVRVCISRDLRDFTACPEVDRKACRSRTVTVLPAR